ncbi:MAG TPA: molybdopterin-dependent oxidoreductase [Thermodesulfobacteriota bacterium]|nr:molybdopterin-dependent oxidoreductase [Thermodesulfobacteriota bacterium]
MIKNTPTICSFCSNGCGMFVRTNGEEALGVLPLISHPVSQGRLCHRGWNRFQNLRSLNRINRPLLRDGNQAKEVGWEEAFQKIKEKLSGILSSYGPQAIGIIGSPWLTNEDNYLTSLFAQHVLTTDNVDGTYRFGGASALSALERTFSGALGSLGSIPSLNESPAILLLGHESFRDFSPVGSRIVQAFLKGSKVILAEPCSRRAEHFYAHQLTESLAGLSFALQEKGAIPDGVWDSLSQAGMGLVFVADQVSPASNLNSLLSVLLQRLPAHNKALNLLTLSRSPNLRGAWDMGIKPGKQGLNLQEMLDADSKIKGLLVFADDVLAHLPSSAMIEKLKKLEFLLVADRFVTKTSQIAHCVLPIPLLAESDGTMTNCEGRVQMLRPALPKRGESRSLLEVLGDIAGRLGKALAYRSGLEVRGAMSAQIPLYQKISSASELDGILLPSSKLNGAASAAIQKPKISEGKFVLVIPNTLNAWNRNQMILESPVLNIEYPSDRLGIRMNPQDARDLKLRMGEKVKIKSERGEAHAPIDLDNTVPSMTLVLPSHFIDVVEGVAGNGDVDPETKSLFYPNLYVSVEKI